MRIAISVVAISAQFRPLTENDHRVVPVDFTALTALDPLGTGLSPHLVVLKLDEEIETLDEAQTTMRTAAERHDTSLLFAYPSCNKFPDFDSLLLINSTFYGQQMNLTQDYPSRDAPADIAGVLLRGDAPNHGREKKRSGWTYLTAPQIADFLPFSLRALMPSEWPITKMSFG